MEWAVAHAGSQCYVLQRQQDYSTYMELIVLLEGQQLVLVDFLQLGEHAFDHRLVLLATFQPAKHDGELEIEKNYDE